MRLATGDTDSRVKTKGRDGLQGFVKLSISIVPDGSSRARPASRSLQRALLMSQVHTGSRYRCGKST